MTFEAAREDAAQQAHDRVSCKERIRTIVYAPLIGRLACDSDFPKAATAGKRKRSYDW